MWKGNQLQEPIPESSSSRQAGGISIPPLRFDSPRQARTGQHSAGSSVSSVVSIDKLRLFYQEKIEEIKHQIQQQAVQYLEIRRSNMQQILIKATYSRQQVKEIMLNKDKQLTQLLNDLYVSKVGQEESKLSLLQTFTQSVTVTDLIQIINDLVKKITQIPSKQAEITLNRLNQTKQKTSIAFSQQIQVLKNQNNIVADKLRSIIERRRNKQKPVHGIENSLQSEQIKKSKLREQRLPTFTNLNDIQQTDSILQRILSEVRQLKAQINHLNGKIESHHLTDKTIATLQKQYCKATQKVDILEHQLKLLGQQLVARKRDSGMSNSYNQQLENAMLKIQSLQRHIDQATDNFNKQTQELQHRLDQRDKKIKMLSEALKTIEIVQNQKQSAQFENTVSNSVDLLMMEVDRLNKQLKKAELEIDGHQLTIMRLSKVADERDKFKEQGDENQLIRQIRQQCEDMTSQNEKTIQQLDKQQELKEEKLKQFYQVAAQKSSRTSQSREYEQSPIKGADMQSDMIDNLNRKIHHKIEELKLEKERNMNLQSDNLQLKQQILFLKGHLKGFEQGSRASRSRKIIIQMIDSYDNELKSEMADCFALIIKILSESVHSQSVLARCQNILKCAQSQGRVQHVSILQKSPIFGKQQYKYGVQSQKVDSIPTLQMPSRKTQNIKNHDKTGKPKRKPIV